MKCLIFTSILLSSLSTVFAGDTAITELLGFSADGNAVAFQQLGTQDGSGFVYCKVMVVDTNKNTYIVPASEVTLRDGYISDPHKACDKARVKIQSTLTKLKLSPLRGRKVFSRLPTDELGVGASEVTFGTFPLFPVMFTHKVSVIGTPTGPDDGSGFVPQLLKVTLNYPDENYQKKTLVLQEDKALPRSRQYAFAYELEDGYVFETEKKTAYVFTIRYYNPGFEGPDLRTMVVAGTIKY